MIRPQTCPICSRELAPEAAAESKHFPFCSERCKLVDFYKWNDGQYAIVEPLDPELIDPESFDPDAQG